jgi:holliday junction DNA helicase RuvA
MIAHLRGIVLEKHPNQLILEAAGIGYDVQVPVSTYTALPDTGAEVCLRVHTNVREDAFQLFGFVTQQEKTVFERLIAVSGIGPKLAITVLSGLATADIIAAIRTGDVARLVRIPGVGKKTAERMILELKDKLTAVEAASAGVSAIAPASSLNPLEEDVLSALLNLGCSRPAAEDALRKAQKQGVTEQFEPLFRTALSLVR